MQIQNPDAAQIIRNQAKLTLAEGFPQNLITNCQPVMDMSPDFHRIVDFGTSGSSGTSGNITIATVGTKDLYITAVTLGITKDSTCDMISGRSQLQVTINGSSKVIAALSLLTLTAQDKSVSLSFNPPIKVDRGSALAITGTTQTFTVGNCMRSASIVGYELNP